METQPSPRQVLQSQPVERFVHTTARTDWDVLTRELFDQVLYRCPYGIAAIHKHRILRWHRLIIRTNELYAQEDAPAFIRRTFRVAHYDAIFRSATGMERHERYDLYKIIDARLGLPLKSLVYGIQHQERADLKALLVFGGERMEGQMERSLERVEKILSAPPTDRREQPTPPGPDDYGSYGELIAALRQVNLKELGRMEIREVASLVNALDAVIEYSPAHLRAKYRVMSDYLINRRRPR
jgi:hypothetical protein